MWMYQLYFYLMIGELLFFAYYILACRSANATRQAAYGIAFLCCGVLLSEVVRVGWVLTGMAAPADKAEWLWLGEHAPFALFWYDILQRHVAKITRKVVRG